VTDVFVHDLAHALGERAFTVEESAAAGRTLSPAHVLRDAGFRVHHVCGPDTTAYDLARRTVEAMDRDAVAGASAIIYATCLTPNGNLGTAEAFAATRDVKHHMDFPVSHLQADLRLDRSFAIGLNQQACTSLLGSVRLARALLVAEPEVERVLCVTADRFPAGAVYEQAYNLISDGAAGWIASRARRGFRVLACHHITNGALVQASDDETVGSYFNYTARLVQETLARAGLAIGDLARIVPQNMNAKAWQILARLLKVDFEKVYFEPLPDVAHVISGDPVINLARLDASGRLAAGDKLLLVMAGYGMNWQALALEKVAR
jgi:3-oxoacyl-[acyl-carrier-protein] synthase-3